MAKPKNPYRYQISSSDSLMVRFNKGNLKEVTSKQNSSYTLEIIKNGRLGYASSNQNDFDYLLKKAIASSEFGDKVSYLYPKKQPAIAVKLYSDKVAKLTTTDLIKIGKSLIQKFQSKLPEVLVDVKLQKSEGESILENSADLAIKDKGTFLSISIEGEYVTKGDILQIGEYYGWRDNTFNIDQFANELIEKFTRSKKLVSVKPAKYPVIFAPEVTSSVFEFLETALSAESVFKKVSRWEKQLNQQVADSRFSLFDDPTIDFAAASTKIDDEGNSVGILPLIENGVLKNFYTDLKNAKRLGMKPNGRGFGIPASPTVTNWIIKPGEKDLSEIIKNTKKGIIVYQVIGGGQDSPYSGDFSLNIHLGFLIENGEIVGRIKNYMVSGNIFEMLKNQLVEISSNSEWYGGSLNFPYLVFKEMNIVGT